MAAKPPSPPRQSLRKRAFTGHRVWDGPVAESSGPEKKRINRRLLGSISTLIVLPLFVFAYLCVFNDTYSVKPPAPTHGRVYQWVSAPPTEVELHALESSRIGRTVTTAAAHRIADKMPLAPDSDEVRATATPQWPLEK
jgi:hypothetical protein